jgi:maltooligosyltrehalose trehalohydrolase
MIMFHENELGAVYIEGQGCHFRVWAPSVDKLEVHLISPQETGMPLEKDDKGYYSGLIKNIKIGSKYRYRLNGKEEFPDPASRFQPEGVHGASQVVNRDFPWEDGSWSGISLEDYITYELHTGCFTEEGTFQAIIPLLTQLKELGITAVEIMPVAQFPGERNWGYDGVFPFAVQNSYGGPAGLKQLVNACHKQGLAVILDVVYNHIGPEGNYFEKYGPYFTDRYKTPWGKSINFDGAYSDEVRRYFIQNAVYWLTEFHIDALRLDALHAILDMSARPFLAELSEEIGKLRESLGRHIHLIAESDSNDRRVVLTTKENGFGMDAQWNDDFHHALHSILTGEKIGYYKDFGEIEHLAKAFREGFVYSGQYSAYRRHRYGSSSRDIPANRFEVFIQNHDQIGNRMLGDRLNRLISFEKLKLAAATIILSPFLPLIFMGEEYAEPAPFQYFISHSDPGLIEAVRKGRQREFASFHYEGRAPDPQNQSTFLNCKLDHSLKNNGRHRALFEMYKELFQIRKAIPALANLSKDHLSVTGSQETKAICIHRWLKNSHAIMMFNFSDIRSSSIIHVPAFSWKNLFDSSERKWMGEGSESILELISSEDAKLTVSPNSCVLFVNK